MTTETPPTWRGQYLGWICLAALVFFNVLPRAYVQMVNFPYILVWQIGFLCLGIWGIWMLRQFNVPFQPLGYGLDWGVGLILLALILSVSFADFKEVAAYNFSMALGYGVLLYTLRNWLAYSALSWQKLWLGLCILASLVGWASLFFWLNAAFQEEGFRFVRNSYPLGNANFSTSYFLLVLPLVFAYSLCCRGWKRWLGLVCSAELLFVFYTTGSRGGLLGFFTLLIAGIILVFLKGEKAQKRNLVIGIISLVLVSLLFLGTNPKVQEMFPSEEASNETATMALEFDNSIRSRLVMWETGINLIQDNPLLGVGIGNMSRHYNLYRSVEAGTRHYLIHSLHNTPLQILGEMGVIGMGALTTFISFIIYIWYQLYQRLENFQSRFLLYAIAGSLLAYNASVLTDYQLENIGISATITVILVLLLGLADDTELKTVAPLKLNYRRILSLMSLAFLTFACLVSFPLAVAMGINRQGVQFLRENNLAEAVNQIEIASEIVPWDPVYPVHLGKIFLNLRETVDNRDDFNAFSEIAVENFEQGIATNPTDQWFYHELGLAAFPINPEQAKKAFTKVVQISPRGNFYDYYLLAETYLQTNEPEDKVIKTLALQALVQPDFLTFPIWETDSELSLLKDRVLEKTMEYLQQLLSSLPSDSEDYNHVYELQVFLKWWHEQSIENIEMSRLRPVIQAILAAESSRSQALAITQSALEETPENSSLLLLQAWLNPSQYSRGYLEESQLFSDQENSSAFESYLEAHEDPREWLHSLSPRELDPVDRQSLIYAYRNLDIVWIDSVSPPGNLTAYQIVRYLGVFRNYAHEVPPLEELVQEIQADIL